MRISYNWLKQYIETDLTPEEVAQRLTDSGLEVEAVEKVESIPGSLEGLVVGEVVEKKKHPNADRLSLTLVNTGEDQLLHIICGAPNVEAGQKVVVAPVGTTLFTAGGETIKLKKRKVRGEISEGMICAEDEIGLGTDHDGILVLDADAEIGKPAADHFNIEIDYAIEIGLTPNRTDGMSHIGVARDLAAVLSLEKNKKVPVNRPPVDDFRPDNTNHPIAVVVENTEACPRYCGLRLSDVQVGPSPEWLRNRLKTIGLTPINNVVDITNFVLHETGQPLHAFDAAKIKGNKVVVRTMPGKTNFVTLDEKTRELLETDLMICDAEDGMCIAGVFGGLGSGVSDGTTEIFLESAYFNPVWVRKTAKHHGLNTDASFRFERGVDPEMTVYAMKRAALLLKELAGAEITSEIVDIYPEKLEPFKVPFNKKRSDKLIGKDIDTATVKFILDTLDIRVIEEDGDRWLLEVPRYRADVTREADVVEEILRIYGFNKIEVPEKIHASLSYSQPVDPDKIVQLVSGLLMSRGFNEMMANSLTTDRYVKQNAAAELDENELVQIVNPLSTDLNVMRQTMLFSGLEAIAYNQNRQQPDLKFFEFGKVYRRKGDEYFENFRLALYLSGKTRPNSWNNPARDFTFFDLKGEVNAILEKLGLLTRVKTSSPEWEVFENGISLTVSGRALVHLGMVRQDIRDNFDIKGEVFYADIDWEFLFSLLRPGNVTIKDIPKFPAVRRDLSLLLDRDVTFEQIRELAFKSERKLLKSVELFDVYEGKNLEAGKKSYAVSFVLQDPSKTLNDKLIDKVMQKIRSALERELGAQLRG